MFPPQEMSSLSNRTDDQKAIDTSQAFKSHHRASSKTIEHDALIQDLYLSKMSPRYVSLDTLLD
jgi:hypothetical protein